MGETYKIKNQEALFFLTFQVVGCAVRHMSPRTTEIYTNVSTQSLGNIKNPFDDMDI